MPYCPDCKYEFEEGIKECPDCKKPLVDNSPEKDQPVEVRWVLLKTLPSAIFAEMVKEALENEGIPSFIKADFFQSAFSSHGTAMPGSYATILVPENKLEHAKDILKGIIDQP